MGNFNRVILMGNLTADPELRYTPDGTAVCHFRMAINESYTNKQGERVKDTCYVDVTMWRRRGEVVSEYFSKGDPIFIEGRLKLDTWETPDGRRSKLKVVAQNFEFVAPRGQQSRPSKGEPEPRPQTPPEQQAAPEQEGVDVSDDEIPF